MMILWKDEKTHAGSSRTDSFKHYILKRYLKSLTPKDMMTFYNRFYDIDPSLVS